MSEAAPRQPGGDARVQAAFAEEETRGLRLATQVRLAVLAVLAAWLPVENAFPAVLYYYALLVIFALLGATPLLLRRAGRDAWWTLYLFAFLDVSTFTGAILLPNPLEHGVLPPQMRLRFGNEMYLFLFLLMPVLTYSPRLVLWTGCSAALAWSAGTWRIATLPDSISVRTSEQWANMRPEEILALVLHPRWVNLGLWGRVVMLVLLVAAALATVVWRSRRLVLRQAHAERERANLSRYFSPNMVDELATSDEPLRVTRTQRVAVLFVDIVGFTARSATQSPDAVITMLRAFHQRMARAVFAHAGTLDKYLGDGLMATFGTPHTSDRDATNAVRCARVMTHLLAEWNAARRDDEPIRIGIGVHYGQVVLGDIGDAQHLEFAVLGDTVNVASRLQALTRSLDVEVVLSQDLLDAAQAEGVLSPADLEGFIANAPQSVRGRDGQLRVWTHRRAA